MKLTITLKFVSFSILDRFDGVSPAHKQRQQV